MNDAAKRVHAQLLRARLRSIAHASDVFRAIAESTSLEEALARLKAEPLSFTEFEARFLIDRPISDFMPQHLEALRAELNELPDD